MGAGDALKLADLREIALERGSDAEVLLFDLNWVGARLESGGAAEEWSPA